MTGPLRFHYQAFGLQILSELECPELAAGAGPPDVHIRLGTSREDRVGGCEPPRFEVEGARFQCSVPGAGAFRVEDGRTITVTPAPDADPAHVRVFLLGSVVGALLHQRGCLPLHGSALRGRGGAIVLTGARGAGKSTLAAALQARGLGVMSDDVCAVSFPEEGPPLLQPAYPRLHLRPDAVDVIGAEPGSLTFSRKAAGKYALDVRPSFCPAPAPVALVLELQVAAVERPRIEELQGHARLQALLANTYRPAYLRPMGLLGRHFQQAGALAEAARVCRLLRPAGLSGLPDLAERVLELDEGPRTRLDPEP